MSADIVDPIAEAAARELADQLSATLIDTVDGAATRALGRVEAELQRRVSQIDDAPSRVVELIDTIGGEMRIRAVSALSDGVRTEVVPALTRDEERLRAAVGEMDHAIQTVISDTRNAVLHATDLLSTQAAEGRAEQTKHAEQIVRELRKQHDSHA